MSFESCWASSGLSWLRSSRLHSFVWLWGIAVVAPSRHLHALLSTWDVYFDAQYWAWDLRRLLSRHKPASAVILPLLNHYWMLVSGCLGSKHPNVLYIEQGKPRSSVAPQVNKTLTANMDLAVEYLHAFRLSELEIGAKMVSMTGKGPKHMIRVFLASDDFQFLLVCFHGLACAYMQCRPCLFIVCNLYGENDANSVRDSTGKII